MSFNSRLREEATRIASLPPSKQGSFNSRLREEATDKRIELIFNDEFQLTPP